MRPHEGYVASFTTQTTKNVDAANANTGALLGGVYQLSAACAAGFNSASAQLTQVGPDGVTALNVGTAITAAGVQGPLYLPPGQYKWTVSVGTPSGALSLGITRVPFD